MKVKETEQLPPKTNGVSHQEIPCINFTVVRYFVTTTKSFSKKPHPENRCEIK